MSAPILFHNLFDDDDSDSEDIRTDSSTLTLDQKNCNYDTEESRESSENANSKEENETYCENNESSIEGLEAKLDHEVKNYELNNGIPSPGETHVTEDESDSTGEVSTKGNKNCSSLSSDAETPCQDSLNHESVVFPSSSDLVNDNYSVLKSTILFLNKSIKNWYFKGEKFVYCSPKFD